VMGKEELTCLLRSNDAQADHGSPELRLVKREQRMQRTISAICPVIDAEQRLLALDPETMLQAVGRGRRLPEQPEPSTFVQNQKPAK